MNYIIKVKVDDDDKDEGMNEMGVELIGVHCNVRW